jgi:protein-arginine kinase activator protein McsA
MSMCDIDENTQAKCDLCSAPLGAMKDLKHIVSPKKISIAVRNGYKPELILKQKEEELKLIESDQKMVRQIMEEVLASWKDIVEQSETGCEDCYRSIQKYIKKRKVSRR